MTYLLESKIYVQDASSVSSDIFISALNDSERVTSVFSSVSSPKKIMWALPEYGYSQDELASIESAQVLSGSDEAEVICDGIRPILGDLKSGASLCIDITGFMRSHILFLVWYLRENGISSYDVIYTEPSHYSTRASTTFSQSISSVRQVLGFEGQHDIDTSNDILILGVGYEDQPMGQVIRSKESARLIQLHSLPSLSADMYHESLIRLGNIGTISRPVDDSLYFSSADDPFITAETLSSAVREINSRKKITNVYLSPLATKAQTLGFALFYLREATGGAFSIILPVVDRYSRKTSTGVGRTWRYPIKI